MYHLKRAFPWKPPKQVCSVATILFSKSLCRNGWTVLGEKRRQEVSKEGNRGSEERGHFLFFLQTLRRWPATCPLLSGAITCHILLQNSPSNANQRSQSPSTHIPSEEIPLKRFAAAVIFSYKDIVKQKRTNVAKSCKMKMILRRLRDLVFGGFTGSVQPFAFPVKLITALQALSTQDPPALW